MVMFIKNLIWLYVTILIIIIGIYFTFSLKYIQFDFKNMFKNLKQKNDKRSISQLESLMIVLAGRIGVGSISGVALAIYYGGPGTIFWMWIIGLLALPITFAETTLGSKYREMDESNIYKGGPPYYIKKGLKKRKLAGVYAILIIFSYIGGFLTIQSNTITKSINYIISINPLIIGSIITFITYLIIKGGIKKIADFSTKIVPLMILLYIMCATYIGIKNIDMLPTILKNIITGAFNIKSGISAFISMVLIGIERGIFSSEAGVGTGAIASSTSSVKYSAIQGYVQMIGVYVTTFLVCTSTALIILTSNYSSLSFNDLNGIELAQYSFNYHLGPIGVIIMFISICLFSFSTILSGYYDGESSLKYFSNNTKTKVQILKVITLLVLFFGCIITSNLLWNFIDLIVGVLALINLYAVFILRNDVNSEYKKYKKSEKYEKYDIM